MGESRYPAATRYSMITAVEVFYLTAALAGNLAVPYEDD
jgi:hypothetical protein